MSWDAVLKDGSVVQLNGTNETLFVSGLEVLDGFEQFWAECRKVGVAMSIFALRQLSTPRPMNETTPRASITLRIAAHSGLLVSRQCQAPRTQRHVSVARRRRGRRNQSSEVVRFVLSISGLHVGILAAGFFVLFRTGLVAAAAHAGRDDPADDRLCLPHRPAAAGRAGDDSRHRRPAWRCGAGRTAIGFNTLAAAGIVVLVLNPASLFQAGPQLSFLAVATMIAFQPLLMPQPIARSARPPDRHDPALAGPRSAAACGQRRCGECG